MKNIKVLGLLLVMVGAHNYSFGMNEQLLEAQQGVFGVIEMINNYILDVNDAINAAEQGNNDQAISEIGPIGIAFKGVRLETARDAKQINVNTTLDNIENINLYINERLQADVFPLLQESGLLEKINALQDDPKALIKDEKLVE